LDAGGRLIPEFAEILAILIDPKRQVSCVANTAGEAQWEDHRFFSAIPSSGAFVHFEKRDGEYKFVRFPSAADAAAHVSSVLEPLDITARPERDEIVLDLRAYAALLAGADAVQATALRARLARAAPAKPVLTPQLLQNELQKALANPVSSWAAAAGHLLSPVKLDATAVQMTPGMAALQNAGLICPVQRGSVFTDSGEQFANAFNRLVWIAGLTLDVLSDSEWVKAAHLSLFLCADGIVITSSMDLSAPTPNVHLLQASAAGARQQIHRLLDFEPSSVASKTASPPADSAAERTCSACGKTVMAGARFCPWCGSDQSRPQIPTCSACGKPAVNLNAKFCAGCGAKLGFSDQSQSLTVQPVASRTKLPVTSTERRCPNPQCGKVVPADKRFCTSCGTRLHEKG
jgi:hypothetical protein